MGTDTGGPSFGRPVLLNESSWNGLGFAGFVQVHGSRAALG
jgi:hypothetical protein